MAHQSQIAEPQLASHEGAEPLLSHSFRIGNLACTSLSDGHIDVPATLAAAIDSATLLDFLAAHGENLEWIRTPINCLHVASPKHGNILVDSGMRNSPGPHGTPIPTVGKLPQAMAAAGIKPSDIDIVLVSHIHPDHIGGLFYDDGQPVFPNATHYVSQKEIDFWGRSPDLTGTLMSPSMQAQTIETAQRYLRLAAGPRLKSFVEGEEFIEGVSNVLLEGHTPGQVGYLFDTEGEHKLFYSADAIGHHCLSVKRPEWRFAYDTDAALAAKTRACLVDLLIREEWRTVTPHFPAPGIGHFVFRDGEPCWIAGLN